MFRWRGSEEGGVYNYLLVLRIDMFYRPYMTFSYGTLVDLQYTRETNTNLS